MGVGAHALDELRGRPLQTRIPERTLWALAVVSIAGATALGVYACVAWTWWLAPFVVAGAFIVVAYNLELFGGAFHSTLWFALAWGALPALSAYVVEAETRARRGRRRGRLRGAALVRAACPLHSGADRAAAGRARCGATSRQF